MVDDIRQELRKASVIENTAKMNAEQTKTRMEEAKQSCAGYVAEQGKLERELGEIIENEESIRMELEVSENLEKELNLRIEELHALLEKERDTESEQLKISEESHLSLAGMEQQNLSYRKIFHVLKKRSSSFRQNWKNWIKIKIMRQMRLRKRKTR